MDIAPESFDSVYYGSNVTLGDEDVFSIDNNYQESQSVIYQEDATTFGEIHSNEESLELPHGPVELVHQNKELKRRVHLCEETIRHMDKERNDLRNESSRKEQQHIIAIRTKQEELELLRRHNEDLESQNEILRQSNTSLVNETVERNIQLTECQSLFANHEAVLTRLSKVELEFRSIVEQRDGLKEELMELKDQHAKLHEQCEYLKDRNTELNKHMLVQKEDFRNKLIAEQDQTAFWKHKYECELQTLMIREEHIVDIQNDQAEGQLQNGMVVASTDSYTDVNSLYGGNNTAGIEARVQENKKTSKGTPVQGRRKTFFVDPSFLPHCKNCSTVFDKNHHADGLCRFHLSPPQPYNPWKVFKENDDTKTHRKQRFYWPCCDKIGFCQPPGCKALRHHDVVFPSDDEE